MPQLFTLQLVCLFVFVPTLAKGSPPHSHIPSNSAKDPDLLITVLTGPCHYLPISPFRCHGCRDVISPGNAISCGARGFDTRDGVGGVTVPPKGRLGYCLFTHF